MPGKAIKCIVDVDVTAVSCPGTFLQNNEYVYLNMSMLGSEFKTKSVPSSFPLLFYQRFTFEKTFYDCTDPGYVVSMLKAADTIIELRQHTDYLTDGTVIAHCSSNTHEFLYPNISPGLGSGREIVLYKTPKFKPGTVISQLVKLEYSTKTVIKEVLNHNGLVYNPPKSLGRSKPQRKSVGESSLATAIPGLRKTFTSSAPLSSTLKSSAYSKDDMDLERSRKRNANRMRGLTSTHLTKALNTSKRIQARVNDMIFRQDLFDSGWEGDVELQILRESLREERNALNEAIEEADREAFIRHLNKIR